MNKNFNGLYCVHLELSSNCNKNCFCCGRRKIDRDYPEIATNYGFMDERLLKAISIQLPEDIVIQFHNNGEPLMYPSLGKALDLFSNNIKCLNTNGKLLINKKDEIINKLDTITISIIINDDEVEEQLNIVSEFLELKGNDRPYVVFRFLGGLEESILTRWQILASKYNCLIVTRILHSPMGSRDYEKPVTIPEIGMCTELINHMAIDRFGNMSPCVRFDPKKEFTLGNILEGSLLEIWNGEKRKTLLNLHKKGRRKDIPFCNKCEYWGCPIGN